MTTTVLIGTHGNKEISVQTPQGRMVLPPGAWFELSIHDDQTLTIKECGDFVNAAPGVRFEELAAAAG